MAQGLKELKVDARDLELWKTPQTLAVGGREGTLNAQTRCRESPLFCFVSFSWFLLDPITWDLYAGSKEGHIGIKDSEEVEPASCLRHCAVKRAV